MWGIFRAYDPTVAATRLQRCRIIVGSSASVGYATCAGQPARVTTTNLQRHCRDVAEALSNQPQAPGQLVFNNRGPQSGWISTLNGIMYVRSEDLNANGTLKTGVPMEPLILRANAGDCIEVNLTNAIDPSSRVFDKNFNWPSPYNNKFNSKMSKFVGLHPQLLSYDMFTSSGMNVGWNSQGGKDQLAGFGKTVKYTWYAGKIERDNGGSLNYTPVEFGALNLLHQIRCSTSHACLSD